MMKKILIAIVAMFLLIPSVNAANICNNSKYNDLKQKAGRVNAEWSLKFEDEETDDYYFEIQLSNVDSNLMVKFEGVYYQPVDGNITLDAKLTGGTTYDILFYGGYGHVCVEQFIYDKKVKVPVYNKYYKMKECEKYKEFPLCDKWYSGSIANEEDFYGQLDEYKSKIEKGEIVVDEEKNNDSILPIVIAIGAVVLTGAVIFVITNNKKKKRKAKKK